MIKRYIYPGETVGIRRHGGGRRRRGVCRSWEIFGHLTRDQLQTRIRYEIAGRSESGDDGKAASARRSTLTFCETEAQGRMFLDQEVRERKGTESKDMATSRFHSVYVNAVETLVVNG